MVHMRRLEHNGVHGTKKGAMHPDPVSDEGDGGQVRRGSGERV